MFEKLFGNNKKDNDIQKFVNTPYTKRCGSVCYTVTPLYIQRTETTQLLFGYFVEIYVEHEDLTRSEIKEVLLRIDLFSKEFPPNKMIEIDGIHIKMIVNRVVHLVF